MSPIACSTSDFSITTCNFFGQDSRHGGTATLRHSEESETQSAKHSLSLCVSGALTFFYGSPMKKPMSDGEALFIAPPMPGSKRKIF
jgi:hypothetical protein